MRHRLTAFLALFAAVLAAPARAEIDADGFLQALSEHQSSAHTYMMGVTTGIAAANSLVRRSGSKPLFCLPAGGDVSPARQVATLKLYLKAMPHDGTLPLSQVVATMMAEAYPCDQPS